MSHLDDGRLRAFIDGELSDADVGVARLHLEDCGACQNRVSELEGRARLVAQALGRLATTEPAAGARAAVLRRVGSLPGDESGSLTRRMTSPAHPGWLARARFLRTPLARAAMLALLLGAGIATALPASPVRGWIAAGWTRATDLFGVRGEGSTGPSEERAVPTPDGRGVAQSGTPAGVRLDATGREVSIVIRGIEPGALIVVRMVPGGEAGAFADDPATFRTAEGLIEVIGPVERVLVDLPRAAALVSIEVNGGIYLRKQADRIDTTGPVETRTAEEIRLRVR